ncbi:Monocarboxylate transporter 3 [Papilio xuthus]|uniref:Monocarboxylate transporter 3 n=1 Tax=Papilio xuthus TaxID=66420 RepID=A0A194QI08_PAPXU|nr:Monocarboxylate transporter 3 [Papilio xuthus]
METQANANVNRTERGDRVEDLHLDRIVASQPEIGPTPPDGGYGWLIVFSAAVYHVTVPTLLSLYGFIILKAIREEDHEEGELMKIWDVDIALVPVIMVIIRLLLESWCRAMVKIFNMPRVIALSGLCLTVAGVLLSSYSTNAESNDHIVNIFSGIFAGMGCALTGQQTDIIITHYFREKLRTAQRIVRVAPFLGSCLVPLLAGHLCSLYTADVVVMIYGAVIMQNCLFLAAYSGPIYIEKVFRTTYNMLRDAAEDEDEVIFSNQRRNETRAAAASGVAPTASLGNTNLAQDDDGTDVVVFNSRKNAREILDPSVELRENGQKTEKEQRFSSDFSAMFAEAAGSDRFSSDFGSLDVASYSRISGYRELRSMESETQQPQPLYRETTVDAPQAGLVFAAEVTPGTARRTASLKKNFIAIKKMLVDINFYLHALLHLCTTFSVLVLGVVLPPFVWELNPSMNIWSVSQVVGLGHGAALCLAAPCLLLPAALRHRARLCAALCACGALGFYGTPLKA